MRAIPAVLALALAALALSGCSDGLRQECRDGDGPFLARVARTGGRSLEAPLEGVETLDRDGHLFVYAGKASPGTGQVRFAANATSRLDADGVLQGLQSAGRHRGDEDYEVHVAWTARASPSSLDRFCAVVLEEWQAPQPSGEAEVTCHDGGTAVYTLSTALGVADRTWDCSGTAQARNVWDSVSRIDSAYSRLVDAAGQGSSR